MLAGCGGPCFGPMQMLMSALFQRWCLLILHADFAFWKSETLHHLHAGPASVGQVQAPSAEQKKEGAGQGLPSSRGLQSLPPDVAQILAEGIEAVETIEALTPAANELIAKEVANVLNGVKSEHDHSAPHGPASNGFVRAQPKIQHEGVMSSQAQSSSAAAGMSGAIAEFNGANAAAASVNHRAAGSQGPVGQLVSLPAPQGNALHSPGTAGQLANLPALQGSLQPSQGPAGQLAKISAPLPGRRAGPAARSHSRRSMRELGLGVVEEEGKVQVFVYSRHSHK